MVLAIHEELNGYGFNAPESEIVLVMEGLASGEIDEDALQVWLEKYAQDLRK